MKKISFLFLILFIIFPGYQLIGMCNEIEPEVFSSDTNIQNKVIVNEMLIKAFKETLNEENNPSKYDEDEVDQDKVNDFSTGSLINAWYTYSGAKTGYENEVDQDKVNNFSADFLINAWHSYTGTKTNKNEITNTEIPVSESTNIELSWNEIPESESISTDLSGEQITKKETTDIELANKELPDMETTDIELADKELPYMETTGKEVSEKEIANEELTNAKSTENSFNNNLFYQVQIAAGRDPLSQRLLKTVYHGKLEISMIEEEGWHKYSIGSFNTYNDAKVFKKKAGAIGAFVVAFMKGQKINVAEAIKFDELYYNKLNTNNKPTENIRSNIIFRVQIAATIVPMSNNELRSIYYGNELIYKVEEDDWYKYKYSVGEFLKYRQAKIYKKRIRIHGAFVVAYENGKKFDIKEAIEKTK